MDNEPLIDLAGIKKMFLTDEVQTARRLAAALLLLRLVMATHVAAAPATFGLTNIWTIELHASSNSWNTLLKSRDFTQIDATINSHTYTNISARQKGYGTTIGAEGRLPLRLVFKGERVAGVKRLSLNNNLFDTSYLRDVLSYKLCNDFGVRAPKTAFAKLYLKTTDVKSPNSSIYLGLYTVTEIVDEPWLRERFGAKDGLLMKPRAPIFNQASDWPTIADRAVPERQASQTEQARIVAFARLVNHASDDAFARELPSYIELENFLRFLAVNVALANHDSYIGMAKNYYLYLNPTTGKLTWIPWDFDLSFGGHFLFGTPQQRIDLSIDRFCTTGDRLIERVLAIPAMKERYHALLREFLARHFEVAALEKQIDSLAALIQPCVMEDSPERRRRFESSLDTRGQGLPANGWQVDIGLKDFIRGRAQSLNDQLAGKSKGERPLFRSEP
jgi:spore coat protein H